MKRPTAKQIERAAAEIIKIAHPNGGGPWNPEFIKTAKWPKDFYAAERKFARDIARAALKGAFSPAGRE